MTYDHWKTTNPSDREPAQRPPAPRPEPLLWLNDSRGRYIPRDFAQCFVDRAKSVQGVTDEQWAILEDPEHESYWEAWFEVTDNARVTDEKGVVYTLHQDGDLWLIPVGMEWDEKADWFVWPEDDEDDPA
jgi:hypothetical protein